MRRPSARPINPTLRRGYHLLIVRVTKSWERPDRDQGAALLNQVSPQLGVRFSFREPAQDSSSGHRFQGHYKILITIGHNG